MPVATWAGQVLPSQRNGNENPSSNIQSVHFDLIGNVLSLFSSHYQCRLSAKALVAISSSIAKKINKEYREKMKLDCRGGVKTLTTMTVELDLDRMEKMKQEVLELIGKMVDEYGNVSVIELEMALIEGLLKVREIGIEKTEDESEESDVV